MRKLSFQDENLQFRLAFALEKSSTPEDISHELNSKVLIFGNTKSTRAESSISKIYEMYDSNALVVEKTVSS